MAIGAIASAAGKAASAAGKGAGRVAKTGAKAAGNRAKTKARRGFFSFLGRPLVQAILALIFPTPILIYQLVPGGKIKAIKLMLSLVLGGMAFIFKVAALIVGVGGAVAGAITGYEVAGRVGAWVGALIGGGATAVFAPVAITAVFYHAVMMILAWIVIFAKAMTFKRR